MVRQDTGSFVAAAAAAAAAVAAALKQTGVPAYECEVAVADVDHLVASRPVGIDFFV
jgi:hypothetical protein